MRPLKKAHIEPFIFSSKIQSLKIISSSATSWISVLFILGTPFAQVTRTQLFHAQFISNFKDTIHIQSVNRNFLLEKMGENKA